LGRVACAYCEDAASCYRCSVRLGVFLCAAVCQSVCLLGTTVSCAKVDELIDVPLGVWTRVHRPKELCIRWGPNLPQGKGQFWGIPGPL